MTKKRDILAKILRSGSMARTTIALQSNPAGMTLAEICEITGLSPLTVRKRDLRLMFNAQVVEREENDEGEKVYKLKAIFRDGSLIGFREE